MCLKNILKSLCGYSVSDTEDILKGKGLLFSDGKELFQMGHSGFLCGAFLILHFRKIIDSQVGFTSVGEDT